MDVNHLIQNLVRLLPPLIGDELALVTVLAPNLATVRADPGQIEQVVMHLVLNARDAMPDGGRLTLGTANEQITDYDLRADLFPSKCGVKIRSRSLPLLERCEDEVFDLARACGRLFSHVSDSTHIVRTTRNRASPLNMRA